MSLPDKIIPRFLMFVVAAAVLYAALAALTGPRNVGGAVAMLGLTGWLYILGLSVVNYAFRFVRWQRYLQRLGYRLPAGRNLMYYLAGFAFTTTPGKAGEAIRSVYLKREDVAYTHSLAAFFVERLVDVIAMALLATLAILEFDKVRWPIIAAGAATIALLPIIHSAGLQNYLERKRHALKLGKLKSFSGHLLDLLRASTELLGTGMLYTGLGLGVMAWGAEGFALYVVLDYLGVEIAMPLAVGIYAVSILVGALSFIPGGLGSTEAVMGLLLMLAGADAPVAVAATIICRIATLWFAVAIGMVVVAGLEARRAVGQKNGLPAIDKHKAVER